MMDNLLGSFQLCKVPCLNDINANPHYKHTKETGFSEYFCMSIESE